MKQTPPRVVLDDQAFLYATRGGMGRYFAELISQFEGPLAMDVDLLTPYRYVMSQHLQDADPSRYRTLRVPLHRHHGKGAVLLRSLNRVASASPTDIDLVHHTFYDLRRFDAVQAPIHVCTIFDMIPECYPDPIFVRQLQGKAEYYNRCHGFFFISQAVRSQFLEFYGDNKKPMIVTPLAVSNAFRSNKTSEPSIQEEILFVGQRGLYKNFDVLLRAVARLGRTATRILCVGGGPLTSKEFDRINTLGLDGRVVHRSLSDRDLAKLYSKALCLVFPSLYEGFGLPTIEAMAAGCPVLLADTPVFREVAGDAAAYFPATDHETLAALLARLQEDQPWSADLRVRGRQRSRTYTWVATAKATLAGYRTIMSVTGGEVR